MLNCLPIFQKGETGCGRFRTEQLDRIIKPIDAPRSGWWARLAAGVVIALGLSKDVSGQNKYVVSAFMEQLPTIDSTKKFKIYGFLKDEKGKPIANADIKFSAGGIVSGKSITDIDGMFSIDNLQLGAYHAEFTYLGKEMIAARVIMNPNNLKEVTIKAGSKISTEEIEMQKNYQVNFVGSISTQYYSGGSDATLSPTNPVCPSNLSPQLPLPPAIVKKQSFFQRVLSRF